jgi:hypothetical protein
MPDPVWTLNGSTLAGLGLTLAGGSFRSYGVSEMRLQRACDFDADPLLAFGAPVILARDGVPVFSGKVNSNPVAAEGSSEGQSLAITDAWAGLITTIYQEPWGYGTGTVMLPRAVVGLGYNSVSAEWERITAGAQIKAVIDYAIANGVSIQAGAFPTGELMIPSEVANVSCEEMIRICCKLHPDWIPFLDHSTAPPTFHVVPTGTAAVAGFDVSELDALNVVHRTDMLPDAVRVVYELATTIDDEVFREVAIDKFPTDGPDAGPRVITATIPLAGMQMQIQKSRVQTRTIPTAVGAAADEYVQKRFPAMAAVDIDHFVVQSWALALVPEPDPMPDPISLQAPRLEVTTVAEVPRELVKGTLEDWMRRKVAKVRIDMSVSILADATEEERKIIATLPTAIVVTATNATTKIYKGITSWVPPEEVPTGIASDTYQAIVAAMTYQGTVTLTDREIGATSYHGSALNLAGGPTGWAGMRAPVHSVDFDVATGRVVIGFGPIPALAPADFLELQRILRFRPTKWWSFAERGSNKLGAESSPSAAGDTVSGLDQPELDKWSLPPAPKQFDVHSIYLNGATWKCRVKQGMVCAINPEPGAVIAYIPTTPGDTTEFTITSGSEIWCEVTTDKWDLPSAAEIIVTSGTDAHAQPDPGGNTGLYHYKIADFETVGGRVAVKTQFHSGGPITHRPSRNNRNADLIIHQYTEDTDGVMTVSGSPIKMSFRQGLYVGLDAGAADNLSEFNAINLVEE